MHSILFLRSHCIGWRPKHLKTWLWNSLPRTLKWGEVSALVSQMTFLIWFVAEPQLRLAALPAGWAVSDIHTDWSLVTKGSFMPRWHRVSLRHATRLFIGVVWSILLRGLFLGRVMVVEECLSQDLSWLMFKPSPGLKEQVHVSRAHVLAFVYTNTHFRACIRHRPSD